MARNFSHLTSDRPSSFIYAAALLLLLVPTVPSFAGGRRMAASDRGGASVPANSLKYGQATIYRSDEAPKLHQPALDTSSESPASEPGPALERDGDELPVLIHGVPHRAALRYGQSVC
jgi:hypothetical protein